MNMVGGARTILKNDGVKVTEKDDIPLWEVKKTMFQTTNQMKMAHVLIIYLLTMVNFHSTL
jgi:hypothetical protein